MVCLRFYLHLFPRRGTDLKVKLEQHITLSEVEKSIDNLKREKATGPDVLGAEFLSFAKPLRTIVLLFCTAYLVKNTDLIFTTVVFFYTDPIFIPKTEDL